MDRKHWIDKEGPLALSRQCELAGVARSTIYAPHSAAPPDAEDLMLLASSPISFLKQPRTLAAADHFANTFSNIAAHG